MAIMPPPGTKTRKTGAMFRLTLGGPDYEVEVERAPDNAGVPDTANSVFFTLAAGTTLWLDELPADNAYRHWRFRHIGADVNPSSWTGWTKAKPVLYLIDAFSDPKVWNRPRRGEPFTDNKFAVQSTTGTGDVVASGVVQTDGVAPRALFKAGTTLAVQDGDAVTFSPAFQNPPKYLLRGGVWYEPRSAKWSPSYDAAKPQYPQPRLVNLTASGGTVSARIRQKGAQTAQSDDFPSGNTLDAVAETAEANLDPAAAADDRYTVAFDVSVDVATAAYDETSAWVEVAVDTNDGGGWVTRYTETFTASAPARATWPAPDPGTPVTVNTTWADQERTVVVSGLGLNDDVRVRVVSAGGSLSAFAVHAHDSADTPKGVVYTTATDATASMTPDTDDFLELETWAA